VFRRLGYAHEAAAGPLRAAPSIPKPSRSCSPAAAIPWPHIRTVAGTSEPGGYLRPGVTLNPGKSWLPVPGTRNPAFWRMSENGIHPWWIAARRHICAVYAVAIDNAARCGRWHCAPKEGCRQETCHRPQRADRSRDGGAEGRTPATGVSSLPLGHGSWCAPHGTEGVARVPRPFPSCSVQPRGPRTPRCRGWHAPAPCSSTCAATIAVAGSVRAGVIAEQHGDQRREPWQSTAAQLDPQPAGRGQRG
jgi:hypothetical protein